MNNTQILNADYLDIVFAGRNKGYGGYALRKGYNHRALAAVGLVILSMTMLIAGYRLFQDDTPATVLAETHRRDVMTTIDLVPLDIPKPPPPVEHIEPISQGTPPIAPTQQFTQPIVVDNARVKPDDTPPDMKSMDNKIAGPVTHAGTPDGLVAASTANQLSGGGTGLEGAGKGPGIPVKNDEVVKAPDVMPEYPGGKEALLRFLRDHIKYPPQAAELGISGQVVLSFVVNEAGGIENIRVVKSIGAGCDQEAMRVVKSMPAWKPGIKNGRPVKVYYMLPVSYQLR